ncbi:hypothetical protein [Bacteroides sp.]|uniref:hypothetical protein n=1 Tax=Bacteroides sp. TaxID=29523 RepID=UPI00262CA420|nr:hypothetical protein [Bacteroides sp.]MDD3037931.1 hypothetical protein [Bacteroides sp.]
MNRYIIKAAQHPKSDPFGFSEATDHVYLFARGLKDLRDTIRCITPQGYNVRSPRWFGKRLKSGKLTLNNPLLRTTMYEIRQVDSELKVEHEFDFTNRTKFQHRLKIVSVENWK